MLENIKLMLGITNDTYDKKIELYIIKVTKKVILYCNIDMLPVELEEFVENKVINIMNYILASNTNGGADITNQNKCVIKAVTRGDTRIEYDTSSSSGANNTINDLLEFDSEEKFNLNKFRKLKW